MSCSQDRKSLLPPPSFRGAGGRISARRALALPALASLLALGAIGCLVEVEEEAPVETVAIDEPGPEPAGAMGSGENGDPAEPKTDERSRSATSTSRSRPGEHVMGPEPQPWTPGSKDGKKDD